MNKKIKLEIEVDETLLNGLNNAVAAYGDICWGLFLGTEIPARFEPLKQKSEEEIRARFKSVKGFYEMIEQEFTKN